MFERRPPIWVGVFCCIISAFKIYTQNAIIFSMKKETIKTSWDLNLLYKSVDDKNLIKDVELIEKAYLNFEKKYSNKKFLKDFKILKSALSDYEKLDGFKNPLVYLRLVSDTDNKNKKVSALQNLISERLTNATNKILFFRITLGQIDKVTQSKILKNKDFEKYWYFLKQIFNNSKYQLSEAEEKILSLTSLTSRDLWVRSQKKLQSDQFIVFKGKKMSLGEVGGKFRELGKKDRDSLAILVNNKFKEISYFSEAELNAIVLNKKIRDDLRGFKKPFSQTILGYQNDEKSIESLVKTVTKNFKISHDFLKIKAKMLGQKKLGYWDRSAEITTKKSTRISFEQSVNILQKAFSKLGNKYTDILNSYLVNGQIDIFPSLTKKSGAYCWTNANMPTFVFLNHTNDFNSVMTFAHEMGHAIHGEFSKKLPLIYQGHTISVAEVASTLFENFAFEEVYEKLSEEEKVVALHDRINDDISTIFRQIACFNFENDLHLQIREKGALSAEEMAKLMNKHMKSYLGPIFDLKDDDGYFFVSWSHIRNFFYVYSYAYGQLISKALYNRYKKDKKFLEKIERFLSAGESMSPDDIFGSIGINTKNSDLFIDGLNQIKADIQRLDKLVSKKTKK